MIYLASPYTHSDPAVQQARFEAACRAVVRLIREGEIVFSPIVHSHPLVPLGLPVEWDYWERIDTTFIGRSDGVRGLMLPGWRESVGVRAEIKLAKSCGLPVLYLPAEYGDVWPTFARVAKGGES